jgi:PAS domain S-box-containing protein
MPLRNDDSWNQKQAPLPTIGFVLTMVVLIAGGFLGYFSARSLVLHARRVEHTHQVIGALEVLLSTVKDAETGQRGYLLTEDEPYLRRHRAGLAKIPQEIARVKSLIADNADQQARFAQLEAKIQARANELTFVLGLFQNGDSEGGLNAMRNNTGKTFMDEARVIVADMRTEEERLLRIRVDEAQQAYQRTLLVIFSSVVIGVSLIGLVFYLSHLNATQRMRAARSLAQQKEWYRVTLASIGDGVLTTDEQGRVTFLNAVGEALTGWKQDEAQNVPFHRVFNIVNEYTRAPVENPIEKVLKHGKIVGLANHTILISKDGTERPIDDSAAPIVNQDRKLTGVVLVFRDFAEARKKEKELADIHAEVDRQRRLYDSILLNMTDFVYTFDLQGRFTFANKALLNLWQLKLQDILGKNFFELHYPEDLAARLQRQIQQVIETRALVRDQTHYTSYLGERYYDYIFVPVIGAKGEVEAVAGSTRDVTLQKQVQDELRSVAARLSDADRRKDEFLATLAHELRNPLAPISAGLEVMKSIKGDPIAIEKIRSAMERQSQQMVRLIDDLLDMSRITQGKMELRPCAIELNDILQSAIEATKPFIDEAGHQLSLKLAEKPIMLNADPNRLAQVFSNLLNNSTKYTPEGGQIQLSAHLSGSEAVVTVRDNGLGIPRELQSQIFEMFAQIDRPLEKGYRGLGIGLTLVKRLVEMHQGRIEVASEGAGMGTEFRVYLPVDAHSKGPALPPPELKPASPQALRVLVVDDNKDAANMLSLVVKMLGNEVRLAGDGLEAIRVAEEFQPDLMLMDIGMPNMNGYEAARHVRQQAWGSAITLVALTGWGQEEDRRKAKEAGFDHHLVKPADPAELQKLLSRLKQQREPQTPQQ